MRLIDAGTIEPLLKEERDFHKKMYDNMQQPWEHDDKQISGAYYTAYSKSYHAVKDAPTIDAVPVRHGEWIECEDLESALKGKVICSNCREPQQSLVITNEYVCFKNQKTNFCPNCGAKMDGKEK